MPMPFASTAACPSAAPVDPALDSLLDPGLEPDRDSGCRPSPRPLERARLEARLRRIEGGGRPLPAPVSLGLPALDAHLPGGGLQPGALHEVAGARAEWDDAATTGFLLFLLGRLAAAAPGRALLWAGPWRDLYAPALPAFGVDPNHLVLVRTRNEAETLWALEEALACPQLFAAVGEVVAPDDRAARRLQLAAESKGVTALLQRRRFGSVRAEAPSPARSRWRISPAPALASEAGADESSPRRTALGPARWRVELLRCRGAAPGTWVLEQDDATAAIALAAPLRQRSLAADAPLRRAG